MKKKFLKTIIANEGEYLNPILENEFKNSDLKDLINWGNNHGYIEGFTNVPLGGTLEVGFLINDGARVTMEGKEYLNEN